jgi:predicted metal-dependent phosphoesterase TrpH
MKLRSGWAVRAGFVFLVGWVWAFLPGQQIAQTPAMNWYKGNLHTHTINSDGDSTPDAVARWYREHRYQFLVLTDHNYLTNPEGLNSIFAADERFLLIPGEEVTSSYEKKSVHVNAFQIRETIPPAFGHTLIETIQKNVDAIRAAGGLASLNHPNFRWSVTPDELRRIDNLNMFEVYNGHPTVHNFGGGGAASLEEMWDVVLSTGREVYGIAVDDAHSFKEFGPTLSNPGRGWVSVQAAELSENAIIKALERGQFYSSTGVNLETMQRTTDGITLKIRQESDFKYTTRFTGKGGKLLSAVHGLEAQYELKPGDAYVRATVSRSDGEFAWVQPAFGG